MLQYDIVFAGATALACGGCEAAARQGFTAAVIESGCGVGDEFSQAFRWQTDGVPLLAPGRALMAELTARNIALDIDRVSMPALGPVLANRMKNSGTQVFFLSEIMDIAPQGDGYRLEIATCGKRNAVFARAVIDTTADFSCRFFIKGETRPETISSLSVAITPPVTAPALEAFAGRFDGEWYVRLPIESGVNLSRARQRALHLRMQSPEAFGGARIIEPASVLSRVPLEICRHADARLQWQPSAGYPNAARALDAGAALATPSLLTLPLLGTVPAAVREEEQQDVIVAGLGTAGSIALIAAAKRGLRALGLEQLSCMGGSATLGTVTGYYHGVKGGLYQKIDRDCEALGGGATVGSSLSYIRCVALQDELDATGANARFHAAVCGVLTEGRRATGLIWKDEEGFHRARAKYVIDATGNGDAAVMAGCEMLPGRQSDDTYMAFSLCHKHYDAARGANAYGYRDNGFIDPRDAEGFGRKLLGALCEDNQLSPQYAPEPRYMGAAPFVGVREGARIVGEETVRLNDFLKGEVNDHPAYWCLTNIDQHNKDHAFESKLLRGWLAVCGMWGYDLGVPVPPGALIPKGWDGILCAGRCVSMDHDAALGLRMRDDCSKSGEAAATLAACALTERCPARDVPYSRLREALYPTGCLKPEDGPAVTRQRDGTGVNARDRISWWIDDAGEARRYLASDRPGIAIWSAARMGERIVPTLRAWSRDEDRRLRINSALALGLMGDPYAADVLLEAAADRSGYTPDTSWMYVPPQAVSAICALGLLACADAAPLLLKIVGDPDYARDVPFCPGRYIRDREDLYFQFFTHAFVALCEIGGTHPALRDEIRAALSKIVGAPGFSMRSTMMDADQTRPEMRETLQKILRRMV